MLFVARETDGRIRAVFDRPGPDASEALPATHPDLIAFVLRHADADAAPVRRLLAETDPALARVVEDLIEALIAKGLLMFTDLPQTAQEKLLQRRAMRDRLHGCESFMVGERDIL